MAVQQNVQCEFLLFCRAENILEYKDKMWFDKCPWMLKQIFCYDSVSPLIFIAHVIVVNPSRLQLLFTVKRQDTNFSKPAFISTGGVYDSRWGRPLGKLPPATAIIKNMPAFEC